MGEEGAWLWLLEWQLSKFQPNRWKRLPKGTKIRLISTSGLEKLFSAFASGIRPVDFLIDNRDIAAEPGILRGDLCVNEDFVVVTETAFGQVLAPYVENAIEAVIVWQGILKPSLYHSPSPHIHILECFEETTTLRELEIGKLDWTVREILEDVQKEWRNKGKSVSFRPTWWTSAIQPDFGSYEGREVPFCPLNRRLNQVQMYEKALFKVLNSTVLIAEHRLPLVEFRPREKLGIGLENLGKTCFLNAVLQCLLHIPVFAQYLLYEYEPKSDFSLCSLLRQLLIDTYSNEKLSVVRPDTVFEKLRETHNYEKRTREDANEVFLVILDILQKEQKQINQVKLPETGREDMDAWLDYLQQEPSVKSELFGGLQEQRLICSICQHQQVHTLPFCSLSLDLPSPRTFSITIVSFDPIQPQNVLKLESNTLLEENAIIHSVRELVISETGNPNVILGENRNCLLESRIGLSNLVTSSSFIALELPTLEADLRLILVDFYSRTDPLCTRVIGVHRGVRLAEVISEVIYLLVQVEAAKEGRISGWLGRSNSEHTFRHYLNDGELVFLAQNERVEPIARLREQGIETVGDLCINLGDKIPRFRFISGNYSSAAKGHLKTIIPTSGLFRSFFAPKPDSKLTVTLLQMLDFTLCDKPLNEEDLLPCPHCEHPTQHIVTLRILKFPRILPLVFQRVRVLPTQLSKSFIQIQYPVEGLDLGSREMGVGWDPAVYDLQAVVQHKGGSLTKGHYVACAEDPASMRWVTFNDEQVEQGEALVDGAYMLFYVRRLD